MNLKYSALLMEVNQIILTDKPFFSIYETESTLCADK